MKKWIIITLIVVAVLAVVFFVVRKEANTKKERSSYSGYTRPELKRKLQLAWKDRFFDAQIEWIKIADEAKQWRDDIESKAESTGVSVDKLYKEAAQFSWATDNPKAWDNAWSRGWIEHIYLKEAGIEATPEIKQLLTEI